MRPDPLHAWRRERGFTLLEVMVALAIAAVSLSVLFAGTQGGLLAAEVAGRYGEATARARSHLAAVGHGAPLVAGESGGQDGSDWRWQVRIAPVASLTRPVGMPVPTLFAVSVIVSWGEGEVERSVRLDTRRLGLAAPASP